MSKFVMDIETTGLSYRDDIIEICVLRLGNNYDMEDTFYRLLSSKKRIPKRITEMTGITDDDIKGKLSFSEIKNDLYCFIRGNPIYIYGGLEGRNLKRYGFKNNFINVYNIVKRRYPDFTSYKLESVLKRFKIVSVGIHRATGCAMTLSFLMKGMRL